MQRIFAGLAFFVLVFSFAACTTERGQAIVCDPDNGGLTLPDGFCAVVVADSIGPARHMAIRDNGDVYVALRRVTGGGGIVGLRDTTGDGKADLVVRFGEFPGSGIGIYDGHLYFAPDTSVFRYRFDGDELAPLPGYEQIAGGFPVQGLHAPKLIALDGKGGLYVNVGAPSNNCQDENVAIEPPGFDPCPAVERHAGIWRFDASRPGQTQAEAEHYAVGVRNSVAIAWNSNIDQLYVVEHGRDILNQQWPELYSEEESAELPAERFLMLEEGKDYGWPYCYYDHLQQKNVLSPEYGGDGTEVGRCSAYADPLMGFPGHYSPNGLTFYTSDQFPERYRNGAFVAFHGSWNRAPFEQKGFNVVFVPFDGKAPSGDWEVFADGFAGVSPIMSVNEAKHRPMDVDVAPDGSLYVVDSLKGKIWRIVYRGR